MGIILFIIIVIAVAVVVFVVVVVVAVVVKSRHIFIKYNIYKFLSPYPSLHAEIELLRNPQQHTGS